MANSIASPDCNKAFRRVRLTPAFTFSTFLSGKRFPEGALAMDSRLSRRGFLRAAGTAAAAAYATRAIPVTAADAQPGSVTINLPLATFPYSDVQLLDGPMKRQFEENHARFLNLDDDRLLKVFRQVAGLPAPGEDMAAGMTSLASASSATTSTASLLDTPSANTYLALPAPTL